MSSTRECLYKACYRHSQNLHSSSTCSHVYDISIIDHEVNIVVLLQHFNGTEF